MVKNIELKVYGMTCDDCVAHVTEGLKSAIGVKDVYISLKDGRAIVKADDNIDPKELEKLDVFTKTHYRAQVRSVKYE